MTDDTEVETLSTCVRPECGGGTLNPSAARGVRHIVSNDTLPTGPAGVAEVADATDLKSVGTCVPCGFESHPRHRFER